MEYAFGTRENIEVLRTKGDAHTSLTNFCRIEQVYPNQTIINNFRVVRKLGSAEDCEGNCYDWYEIDRRFYTIDKTPALAEQVAETNASVENALCEQDVAIDERISALEDAMCELDAVINK